MPTRPPRPESDLPARTMEWLYGRPRVECTFARRAGTVRLLHGAYRRAPARSCWTTSPPPAQVAATAAGASTGATASSGATTSSPSPGTATSPASCGPRSVSSCWEVPPTGRTSKLEGLAIPAWRGRSYHPNVRTQITTFVGKGRPANRGRCLR